MEIFKSDILKKEFERFQKENLAEISKCGYCQKTACESCHNKFLVINFLIFANIVERHFANPAIILM